MFSFYASESEGKADRGAHVHEVALLRHRHVELDLAEMLPENGARVAHGLHTTLDAASLDVLLRTGGEIHVVLVGERRIAESLHDVAVQLDSKRIRAAIHAHVGAGVQRRVEMDVREDLRRGRIEKHHARVQSHLLDFFARRYSKDEGDLPVLLDQMHRSLRAELFYGRFLAELNHTTRRVKGCDSSNIPIFIMNIHTVASTVIDVHRDSQTGNARSRPVLLLVFAKIQKDVGTANNQARRRVFEGVGQIQKQKVEWCHHFLAFGRVYSRPSLRSILAPAKYLSTQTLERRAATIASRVNNHDL